jgi:hypothetical protein
MFVGRRFSEGKLIRSAYAFDQATLVYKKNRIIVEPSSDLPTVDLSHVATELKQCRIRQRCSFIHRSALADITL